MGSDIVYVLTMLTYTALGTHAITNSNELAYTLSNTDCIMERNRQRQMGNREGYNQQFFCMRVDDPVMRHIILQGKNAVIYNGQAVRSGDIIVYGDVIIHNH